MTINALLLELHAWAYSHAALQAGRGNVDDVEGFIAWVRAAEEHRKAERKRREWERRTAGRIR